MVAANNQVSYPEGVDIKRNRAEYGKVEKHAPLTLGIKSRALCSRVSPELCPHSVNYPGS